MTQRVEYATVHFRGLGTGHGWFADGERLGGWEALTSILNGYAARGWRVLTTASSHETPFTIILERPFEGHALVPADAPAGRGDELTPTE